MKYQIKKLLADRGLLREVLAAKPYLTDGNGVLQTLDFSANKVRTNHIALFQNILAVGGTTALERVLRHGGSLLTRDVNAAKNGVVRIKGAEGYYLMTNAGDPTAFSSILQAVWGFSKWAGKSFDLNKVIVTDELPSATGGSTAEKPHGETERRGISEEDNECPADVHDYCFVRQDGVYRIRDNRKSCYITVESGVCKGKDGKWKMNGGSFVLDTVAVFEPINRDDLSCGWRYQRDEGGAWGFIGAYFSIVLPPLFTSVDAVENTNEFITLQTEDETLVLHTHTDRKTLTMSCRLSPLYGRFKELCCSALKDRFFLFRRAPDLYGTMLTLLFDSERGAVLPTEYYISFDYSVIARDADFCDAAILPNLADTPERIALLLEGYERLPHYEQVMSLNRHCVYALCRDGLWGPAVVDGNRARFIIGCCYSSFRAVSGASRFLLLEHFGLWGVYDLEEKCFKLPCRYDSIEAHKDRDGDITLTLRYMELVGKCDLMGGWIEPLHRQ